MIISIVKAREAAEVLGVELEGLTTPAVSKAYRTKAKDCHPDHHGTRQMQLWSRVSWAKEVLDRWLRTHPDAIPAAVPEGAKGDCRACDGTGRVAVRRGGFGPALTMQCVMCKGLGTLIAEENDFD